MRFPRAAGILMHPTSLPGLGGVGGLGPESLQFLETLDRAGQRIWQVLPLGPTGYGESPYQCFSAFAGNPMLISPEILVEWGLLEEADLEGIEDGVPGRASFAAAVPARKNLLGRAFENFEAGSGSDSLRESFQTFQADETDWLSDFCLFLAIKEEKGGGSWTDWPEDLARREDKALEAAAARLSREVEQNRFIQFLFFEQWGRVRSRAGELGIQVLGDIPIFVASDSADVWANPQLFELEDSGKPRVVAGVPPDYFSATGQLWGNPLYRWDVHREDAYSWWIARMRSALSLFDRVRVDHFRGFHDYWEIPGDEETAINGRWVDGPGGDLFEKLGEALGELAIVAEDLGDLSDGVFELRDRFEFPGMRVLHFGFAEDPKFDAHSPHQHIPNCAIYTGTHDNDTTCGWFNGGANTTQDPEAHAAQRARVLRYTGTDGSEIHWDLIRLALLSVADTAIVPLQDVLGLGSEARMNVPGQPAGNWTWRAEAGQWTDAQVERLASLTEAYGR